MNEKYEIFDGCSVKEWLEYLTTLKNKYDKQVVKIEEAINFYKEKKDER